MNARFLAFDLGKETYAVPLEKTRELTALPDLEPQANGPDWVLGSCRQRGHRLLVISLHPFLHRDMPIQKQPLQLLILTHLSWSVGIPVSAPYSFSALPEEWQTLPHLPSHSIIKSELILNARAIGLIDLARLQLEVEKRWSDVQGPTSRAA